MRIEPTFGGHAEAGENGPVSDEDEEEALLRHAYPELGAHFQLHSSHISGHNSSNNRACAWLRVQSAREGVLLGLICVLLVVLLALNVPSPSISASLCPRLIQPVCLKLLPAPQPPPSSGASSAASEDPGEKAWGEEHRNAETEAQAGTEAASQGEGGKEEEEKQQEEGGEEEEAAHPDPSLPSRCPKACTEHGTCNEAQGQCACLYGFKGEDCASLAFPSCMTTPGFWTPCCYEIAATCACAAECAQFLQLSAAVCVNDSQVKRSPEGTIAAPDMIPLFKSQRYLVRRSNTDTLVLPMQPAGPPQDIQVLTPEHCGGECSRFGVCGIENTQADCQCTWPYAETTCALKPTSVFGCFGDCSGKGDCVLGVCHCQPGYFGIDCAMYMESEGRTRLLRRPPFKWAPGVKQWPRAEGAPEGGVRPRIFVYELPPHFNTWVNTFHADRQDAVQFLERLLNSPFRTADPEQADFFYIPIMLRSRDVTRMEVFLNATLKHIKSAYPYWERKQGRDHIAPFMSADWGACQMGDRGRMGVSVLSMIVITLWGCAKSMYMDDVRPCFRPGHDIVAPPFQWDAAVYRNAPYSPPYDPKQPHRTTLLFFTGSLWNSTPTFQHEYVATFGVRQAFFAAWGKADPKETGFNIVPVPEGGYPQDFYSGILSSVFCFAPAGWGWGMRATQAVIMGCIPVVIQPFVHQAFEGEMLNWKEFGVVLEKDDIPNLLTILRGVSQEEIERKRLAMQRVWKLFVWTSYTFNPLEGAAPEVVDEVASMLVETDAFQGIMVALKKRMPPL